MFFNPFYDILINIIRMRLQPAIGQSSSENRPGQEANLLRPKSQIIIENKGFSLTLLSPESEKSGLVLRHLV